MQDAGDYIVDQPLNELKHDASKASSNEAPDSFNERQWENYRRKSREYLEQKL